MKSSQQYFVRKMSVALLERWPEWKQYLQTPRWAIQGFWLIVPAPNKDITRGLSISIDGRMVIVGFDDDHDHLWQRKKESMPQFRNRVLERINELMQDKIFAISWRDEENRLRTSNSFDTDANPFVVNGYKCRIRSWSGRRDQDFVQSNETTPAHPGE